MNKYGLDMLNKWEGTIKYSFDFFVFLNEQQ
jgi:hypothetical protein